VWSTQQYHAGAEATCVTHHLDMDDCLESDMHSTILALARDFVRRLNTGTISLPCRLQMNCIARNSESIRAANMDFDLLRRCEHAAWL